MIQIDRLLTIDDTGMPKAPNTKQLLDKDVKFDTATLKAESGILTKVVYTIIKQGR